MRLAAYAGVSIGLAGAVVLRAFHERPNFYSASVYLSQSNACRMILLNFLLFTVGSLMVGLQRLLYGTLRTTEIEQLWDKAWYAVTETALAMTTFRDDIGSWFFIMFIGLLAGKVWSWMAEGRLETLEQQPPNNPRLFHTRLMISLLLSEAFTWYMLQYCIRTVLEEPRPGMMVMFAFEFAILVILTTSLVARYVLSLVELWVTQRQTAARLEERKQEIRTEREAAEREAASNGVVAPDDLPREEDIDVNEIDVPGWQEKGRWVFYLDLCTDFFKLVVYLGFFTMLILFHGIPIHILRDVFLTMRSFIKRILDFIKYRNATRDMNARFPDATVEELERDGTCIICREDMRPWQQPDGRDPPDGAPRRPPLPTDQRQRAKKLPCGHILHFGCLRSWLERQQVCPTCRRSVLAPPTRIGQTNETNGNPARQTPPARVDRPPERPPQPQTNNQPPRPNPPRARTFDLGPVRITFAAGNHEQVQNALQGGHAGMQNNANARQGAFSSFGFGRTNNSATQDWQDQLTNVERQITEEIANLNAAQEQLGTVRALQGELARLRMQQGHGNGPEGSQPTIPPMPPLNGVGNPPYLAGQHLIQGHAAQPMAMYPPRFGFATPGHMAHLQLSQQHVFHSQQLPMGQGHPQLPAGLTLPEGWTLMPLQRMDHGARVLSNNTSATMNSNANLSQVHNTTNSPSATISSGSSMLNTGLPVPAASSSQAPSNSSDLPNAQTLADEISHHEPTQSTIPTGAEIDMRSDTDEDLPDWSNNAATATATAASSASQGPVPQPSDSATRSHEEGLETVQPAENGHAAAGKGKARAATVADGSEEDET